MKAALAVVPKIEEIEKPLTLDQLVELRNQMIRAYEELPKRIALAQAEINIRVQAPSLVKLSEQQRRVLHYVRARMSNKEIAVQMNLAERTIKFHVSALLRKLGGKNRQELM